MLYFLEDNLVGQQTRPPWVLKGPKYAGSTIFFCRLMHKGSVAHLAEHQRSKWVTSDSSLTDCKYFSLYQQV